MVDEEAIGRLNSASTESDPGAPLAEDATVGQYFPWLEGLDNDLFVAPLRMDSETFMRRVSTLAIDARSSWTFNELFPGIPSEYPVRLFATSVRLSNVLLREGVNDFGGMSDFTLREAIGFRNMGAKSIDELLTHLGWAVVKESEGANVETRYPRLRSADEDEYSETGDSGQIVAIRQLERDLTVLSLWNRARGLACAPLFDQWPNAEDTPAHVMEAVDRIATLTAIGWTGSTVEERSIGSLLDEMIGQLGNIEREILIRRIASNSPDTLDTLGNDWGVTRERVRQIEAKLKVRIQNWLEPTSELGIRAAALRQRVRPVAHRLEILRDIPSVDGEVVCSGLPTWMLLDKLDDGFESDAEWLAVPSIAAVQAETQLQFEQLSGPHGSVSAALLSEVLLPWTSLSESRLSDWLIYSAYFRVGDGWALLERRSIPNFAAAYLEQAGVGTSIDEIHLSIPWEHSLNSLRNALAEDDRFISVARAEWELRSWGGTEYSGIKDAIATAINANDGVVALEVLMHELSARLNVSENSVRTYASGWPFTIEKGLVRFATERKSRPRSAGMTRNVYLGYDEVRFRIRINRDHLRGSGSPVPSGLAAALGMKPGERREDSGEQGALSVSWNGVQPQLSSIRQILVALDLAVDDQVVLVWSDETLTAAPVRFGHANPIADLLAITGIRLSDDSIASATELLPEVLRALELPAGANWCDVEARASARGEMDLVELVAKAQVSGPAYESVEFKSARAIERVIAGVESMTWIQNDGLNARVDTKIAAQFDPEWGAAMSAAIAVIEKTGQSDQFETLSAQATALSYGDRSRNAAVNAIGALLAMRFFSASGFNAAKFDLLTLEWQSVMGPIFESDAAT